MSTQRLKGKTAIVTGSSSGLGREICIAYAREGAHVCCVDLHSGPRNIRDTKTGELLKLADDWNNRDAAGSATHEHLSEAFPRESAGGPPGYIFVKADVRKADDVENAVRECVRAFGRLDIMVNCAGISIESTVPRPLPVHETPEETWDKTMDINAKGVFLGCKYAIGQMLAQDPHPDFGGHRGWVINIASILGLVSYWFTPAYTASKGAVVQLSKQIAVDYGKHKIHCNAICPGFLRTPMTTNVRANEAVKARLDEDHPLGGVGSAADVAKVAIFLASDDAAWVTGIPLPVDGGYVAR